MKRKRRILTREVYKWKARLTVHGGQQEYGINYWETYAPVVQWTSIHLFLINALLNSWYQRQLDFILAYPQAPIECPLYMKIPKGLNVQGSKKDWALLLIKNVYGAKSAGRTLALFLRDGLLRRGFTQSNYDECVYYYKKAVIMIYVDDLMVL